MKAVVLVFPGSNGERDLFEALEAAGFVPSTLAADAPLPADAALVGLPGGFSYGDYWRAGALARQAPAVLGLPAHVARGGLVLGICNGFQILVEAGLLPGALRANEPPGFVHAWVDVVVQAPRPTPWLTGLTPGEALRLPIAHAEGSFVLPGATDEALAAGAALRYAANPNGSQGAVAGVVDPSGRVLGLMPHPERAVDPLLGGTDGLRLLRAARRALHGAAAAPC